jgi:hypothetical protein
MKSLNIKAIVTGFVLSNALSLAAPLAVAGFLLGTGIVGTRQELLECFSSPSMAVVAFLTDSALMLLGGYVTGRIAGKAVLLNCAIVGGLSAMLGVWLNAPKSAADVAELGLSVLLSPVGGGYMAMLFLRREAVMRVAAAERYSDQVGPEHATDDVEDSHPRLSIYKRYKWLYPLLMTCNVFAFSLVISDAINKTLDGREFTMGLMLIVFTLKISIDRMNS